MKLAQQKKAAEATTKLTATSKKGTGAKKSGTSTPVRSTDSRQLDIAALNLEDEYKPPVDEPPPKISVAREKALEEAKKQLEGTGDKKSVSLVVIGRSAFFWLGLIRIGIVCVKAMSMPVSLLSWVGCCMSSEEWTRRPELQTRGRVVR